MGEAARVLKTNPKLAGTACGWCAEPLALGADARLCNGCEVAHHAPCWDRAAGCSNGGCINAPLRRLDDLAAAAPVVPPGFVACPVCRAIVQESDGICSQCNAVLSPDGIYHGPTVTAPGAVASLIWGIVGVFIFGLILGIIAISKSNAARAAIRANPKFSGYGLAVAGLVIGIVDIIGWAVLLFARATG